MRIILRTAFVLSVIALAGVASMLIPLDGSLTRVRVAGAADPIAIDITSAHGSEAISFGSICNTEMAPGDLCADLLTVRNTGSPGAFAFTYTISVWMDDNGTDDGAAGPGGDVFSQSASCFHINLKLGPVDGTGVGTGTTFGPITGAQLALGASEDWGLEVAVNDDNACQGQSAFIMGLVFATSVDGPTPTPTPPIVFVTPITNVVVPPPPPPPGPPATTSQVQGSRVTAPAVATRTTETQGIQVTNLPQTGQASSDHRGASGWLLASGALLALIAAALFAVNVYVETRARR